MKKLNELETELRDKRKALQELLELREKESREFTADEATRFDANHDAIEGLIKSIEREKKAEDHRKQQALNAATRETPEAQVAKRFSFTRGISLLLNNRALDGAEGEMSLEAEKEQKAAGIHDGIRGLGVPGFMIHVQGRNVHSAYAGERRDLTVGGAATGAELVPTEMTDHIYGLHINPKVIQLGATTMMGLTGNVEMSKSGTATAVWATENATSTETTPATSKITLSPKRLTAFADISRTLIIQRGISEGILKTELQTATDVAIDIAAINGPGSGGAPTGILNLASVLSLALGANGALPTRANLITLWKKLADANSDMLNEPSFLTTPGVKAYLWGLLMDAGSGRFVWENDSLIGYKATTSNTVPSTLTKGSAASICHAIILGNWPQLLIGNWGGLDILVNPYTKGKENLVELIVNMNWDINARHHEAFAVIKDALVA